MGRENSDGSKSFLACTQSYDYLSNFKNRLATSVQLEQSLLLGIHIVYYSINKKFILSDAM